MRTPDPTNYTSFFLQVRLNINILKTLGQLHQHYLKLRAS